MNEELKNKNLKIIYRLTSEKQITEEEFMSMVEALFNKEQMFVNKEPQIIQPNVYPWSTSPWITYEKQKTTADPNWKYEPTVTCSTQQK